MSENTITTAFHAPHIENVWVIRPKYTTLYLTVNNTLVKDINIARAFTCSEAKEFASKPFAGIYELEAVKYNGTNDEDTETETTSNTSDHFSINEKSNADDFRDMAIDREM